MENTNGTPRTKQAAPKSIGNRWQNDPGSNELEEEEASLDEMLRPMMPKLLKLAEGYFDPKKRSIAAVLNVVPVLTLLMLSIIIVVPVTLLAILGKLSSDATAFCFGSLSAGIMFAVLGSKLF